MSIVVAVTRAGRTVMACDTQSSFGYESVPADNLTTLKIRRVGGSLLGRTGWGVYDNILEDLLTADGQQPALDDAASIFGFFNSLWKTLRRRYAFVNDQSRRKDTPFGDLGGSFLVANGNGIFYVSSNTGVARFDRYYAIGSGADYALGAIHQLFDREDDPAAIASGAVEAAMAFDVRCGGKVHRVEA